MKKVLEKTNQVFNFLEVSNFALQLQMTVRSSASFFVLQLQPFACAKSRFLASSYVQNLQVLSWDKKATDSKATSSLPSELSTLSLYVLWTSSWLSLPFLHGEPSGNSALLFRDFLHFYSSLLALKTLPNILGRRMGCVLRPLKSPALCDCHKLSVFPAKSNTLWSWPSPNSQPLFPESANTSHHPEK